MKHSLIYILAFCLPIVVNAQLHSLSNQYVLNSLAINPAYAGTEEALSTSIMYRNQWSGFEGAPKTLTAAIHSPLRNELIGIGLLVVNDQIGVNSETSAMLNYAYMVEMGEAKLSLGVGVGVTMLNIGWDKLEAIDINDIELNTSQISITNPNFSAGIYYYTKEFFVGLSIPFFLSYTYIGENNDKLDFKNDISEYNYHLTSGYTFKINREYKFLPSVLVKYHAGEAFQADVSAQFIYGDKIWLGLIYRSVDALAALLQLQVTDQLRIAYSYDIGLMKSSRYYGGSHEVMLKYLFNFNSKVVGPRRF